MSCEWQYDEKTKLTNGFNNKMLTDIKLSKKKSHEGNLFD